MELKIAHISLNVFQSDAKREADIRKVFARGNHIITGTEAGTGRNNHGTAILRRVAPEFGYVVHASNTYDTWVAAKKSLISFGYMSGEHYIMPRAKKVRPKPPGAWGPKALVWMRFQVAGIGTISVGSVHYTTKKGVGGAVKKRYYDLKFVRAIREWGRAKSAGAAISFIGGDFNLRARAGWFYGKAPYVSCWSDLKKHPNTGHGNIDGIARNRTDTQVKCLSARVITDKELHLNTDHFLVETVYKVQSMQ